MGAKSKIEWTEATWNPVRGCTKVSAGCDNCYAMGVAHRFSGSGQPYEGLTRKLNGRAQWNGDVMLVLRKLDEPLRWTRPRHVFVNSMGDLFHEGVPDDYIDQVFAVMALAQEHTFQVLTKRPQRMREYLSVAPSALRWRWANSLPNRWRTDINWDLVQLDETWPLPNVWLGVSVENQATADERVPVLLECRAAVRWISAEPLIGRVDLCEHLGMWWNRTMQCFEGTFSEINSHHDMRPAIGWVIAGGESGPRARPMHPEWARTLRDQCAAARVPFFFKQWGEWAPRSGYGAFPEGAALSEIDPSAKRWECVRLTESGGDGRALEDVDGGEDAYVQRVGKRRAGRLLDGRIWDDYPLEAWL